MPPFLLRLKSLQLQKTYKQHLRHRLFILKPYAKPTRPCLRCLCKSDLFVTEVEHGVVFAHEHISQDPVTFLPPCLWLEKERKKKLCCRVIESKVYQRGPRGGATSRAIKPLMHCATGPSPTFRTYCSHHTSTNRLVDGDNIHYMI